MPGDAHGWMDVCVGKSSNRAFLCVSHANAFDIHSNPPLTSSMISSLLYDLFLTLWYLLLYLIYPYIRSSIHTHPNQCTPSQSTTVHYNRHARARATIRPNSAILSILIITINIVIVVLIITNFTRANTRPDAR